MSLWDVSEAVVACRQLGYRSTGEIIDYILPNNNSCKFTGHAYVISQCDNTWTGGFVAVNCMNGMESSLKNCMPANSTCACGNHARLLCEPGI